jgi:hypothetical protein
MRYAVKVANYKLILLNGVPNTNGDVYTPNSIGEIPVSVPIFTSFDTDRPPSIGEITNIRIGDESLMGDIEIKNKSYIKMINNGKKFYVAAGGIVSSSGDLIECYKLFEASLTYFPAQDIMPIIPPGLKVQEEKPYGKVIIRDRGVEVIP